MTRPGDALPRLDWDEFTPRLQELLRPRVERLGYLGEFFRVSASQPDALAAFVEYTEALKQALPPELTEVIALTIAGCTGNAYERYQHERLCIALGMDPAWIVDVLELSPDTAILLSVRERAVQSLALAIVELLTTAGFARADDELAAAVELSAPHAVVAVLMTVGRYLADSAIVQALDLVAPVDSPLSAAAP